jgi:hypothetical protein
MSRPGERNKVFEARLEALLEAVEQMERDFALPSGGSLLPSGCAPVVDAAKKLREAAEARP